MKRFIVLAVLILVVLSFLPVSQKKDAAETDSDSSAEAVTTDTDAADTVTEPAADSVPEPERTAAAAPVPAEAEKEDDDGYYRFRGYIFTFDRKIIVYSDGSFRVFTEEADEAFANLLSDASMVSGDAKLGPSDYRTSDAPAYLRRKNPTPCWADELHPYGQSVKLTVSEQDQINAYNFLKAHGFKGCVLKMCSDGAIRAAASYPSFSHNARLAGAASSLQNERDAFNNQCFVPMLPGSTFKILSAVVAKKNGMTEFQDPGALPAFKIKNWDYDSNPGSIRVTERFRMQS